jgi:hypothetical protein
MNTIMPEGEDLRRAISWISEERSNGTDLSNQELIQQASLKFNLSPLKADYLIRWIKKAD